MNDQPQAAFGGNTRQFTATVGVNVLASPRMRHSRHSS
jgi:hypothetical protein